MRFARPAAGMGTVSVHYLVTEGGKKWQAARQGGRRAGGEPHGLRRLSRRRGVPGQGTSWKKQEIVADRTALLY